MPAVAPGAAEMEGLLFESVRQLRVAIRLTTMSRSHSLPPGIHQARAAAAIRACDISGVDVGNTDHRYDALRAEARNGSRTADAPPELLV